jgi:hypothetical protein
MYQSRSRAVVGVELVFSSGTRTAENDTASQRFSVAVGLKCELATATGS